VLHLTGAAMSVIGGSALARAAPADTVGRSVPRTPSSARPSSE
jgi:hypothetical protein